MKNAQNIQNQYLSIFPERRQISKMEHDVRIINA